MPFYRPAEDSEEIRYLRARREALGGYVPQRKVRSKPLVGDHDELFREFHDGSDGREVSTTMAFVAMLRKMLKDPEIGKLIVPIVPDEARTFGMESLFRTVGIYSSVGQKYEPVDVNTLLYYKEAKDGQILEEGITEAGSMASFIAAGSAYASHGINTIPFFIYYSMFGFQRIADFIWAAADMRTRGFLLGGTSGRTTLSGEGLQHQDGNSHVLALPVPNLLAYDPAYAYEISVIIQDGIRRMYKDGENIFYYITVMNEPYAMPAMPKGVEEGILKGMYKVRAATNKKSKLRAQLFGSGAILNEALRAQEILEKNYGVAADVWSVTSYKCLYTDAIETERWNRLHPGRNAPRSLHRAVPAGRARRLRRRLRLSEGSSRDGFQVGAAPPRHSRHRRLRPQRRPRIAPRLLRSRRPLHRRRHASRTSPGRPGRRSHRPKRHQRPKHQPRQTQPRHRLRFWSAAEPPLLRCKPDHMTAEMVRPRASLHSDFSSRAATPPSYLCRPPRAFRSSVQE